MIYFQSFRQLALGNEVFVAMPMSDPSFESIWTEVHKTAIESVSLQPFRVDIPATGDSILIEILRGLRRAKLVLADISPDYKSGEYPNANVMYELGIAHSIRLPETVIVVRRKGARLPFDVSHIRVLEYDASDLRLAGNTVRAYLNGALATTHTLRDELVETAWSAMDPVCRDVITTEWYVASGQAARVAASQGEEFLHPYPGLFRYPVGQVQYGRWEGEQLRPAFQRLMEFGIIEAADALWDMTGPKFPNPLYRFTPLGQAMAERFTKA